MASHALPPGRDSPSPVPPPPPPKERRPTLQSNSSLSSKSPSTQSPVRRKPLPTTAFSPALPPINTAQPSTEIFGQVLHHLQSRTRTDSSQSRDQALSPEPISLEESNSSKRSPIDNRHPTHNPSIDLKLPIQGTPIKDAFPKSSLSPVLSHVEPHPKTLAPSPSSANFALVPADKILESQPVSGARPAIPNGAAQGPGVEEYNMPLNPGSRPAPLRTESTSSTRSKGATDQKKPLTPGSKFTSLFTRKQTASPGRSSVYTESDAGKSPLPSPYPTSEHPSNASAKDYGFPDRGPQSQTSQDSIGFDTSAYETGPTIPDRSAALEEELHEISRELAGSIKREMDLEDMVERLQAEVPPAPHSADRTSDYFSDSGTSLIRPPTSDHNPKEEMERIKRDAEQQRAKLKVDFSHRWQREMAIRKAMEAHLQEMGQNYGHTRGQSSQSTDASSKVEELEAQLRDMRRQLQEERQIKDNFQDLLGALQGDLEQHRNQRDNLRDEVVPQLKARIEGLEASLAESQKSPYDHARMQHELQSLRDENAALNSARMMNAQFESIAEEDGEAGSSSFFGMGRGLQRTGTIGRSNSRAGMTRSNSVSKKLVPQELPQNVADQLKAIELQRDALHTTVKYLLRRQTVQTQQYEKRIKVADIERDRSNSLQALTQNRKGGYEREVRGLRAEINLLRKRADDALEQKWQCEKGLAGLKMDLDRSKQETESLTSLLQARDGDSHEFLSSSLEKALQQVNQRQHATALGSLASEQQFADQLDQSAEQIRQQLKTNTALRNRLKDAIQKGERDQLASAAQINELQGKLRRLEDTITSAQVQSETAVMKHEEEVRLLRASNNAQLLRAKGGTGNILSPTPRSPLSPMLSNSRKSPRLDKTTSGPGIPLHHALKTEYLERKVEELEKALGEADKEMGEVVGRMNEAQIGVADLEGERDEAYRQTRKLEEKVRMLVGGLGLPAQS